MYFVIGVRSVLAIAAYTSLMPRAKTLADPASRESIVARISTVTPRASRQWGKMSPHQMLCHLTDSYRSVIGERQVSPLFGL